MSVDITAYFTRAGAEIEPEGLTPDSVQTLVALAPIMTPDNGAGRALVDFIGRTPHEQIGMAQAQALRPVWDALAAADGATSEMPDAGRPDIRFTAAALHKLSCDVTRYMAVAQMQMPIIMSEDIRPQLHLDSQILDAPELDDCNMQAYASFVRGGHTDVALALSPSGDHLAASRFGFIVMHKDEAHDAGGKSVRMPKMVAMPVITVDAPILEQTMAHDGEALLRHFQMIAAAFNHDYFHHFTARSVNPYFNENYMSAINIARTPYGILMGERHDVPVTDPRTDQSVPSLGIEQTARFHAEKYKMDDPVWRAFNQKSAYEFHALHLHNVLYRDYMDAGPAGHELRGHVAGYMDEVAGVAGRMRASGMADDDAQSLKMYYSNLLAFHLLRLVPFGHPVMQFLEEKVENLDLSPRILQRNVERALSATEDAHPGVRERMAVRTGIDARALDDGPITAAESVRACAFMAAERVLNPIYHPRYEEPRGYALSALRQNISVVQRDMKIVEMRGGVDAAVRLMAGAHGHKMNHDPGALDALFARLGIK
jgi:hypothetical protein